MIGSLLVVFGSLISSGSSAEDLPSISAQDPYAVLKSYEDPMWIGPSLNFQFYGGGNSSDERSGGVIQAGYGTEYGVAFTLGIPYVLTENHPTRSAGTPRIGGVPSGRITGNILFRLYGDASDYFIITLGAGFPYQTAGALQNTAQSTWALPASILGRMSLGQFAILPALSDLSTFGTTQPNQANGNTYYQDPTNTVSASLRVDYYLNTFTAPFLIYTETFPTGIDYGTDSGVNTFIYDQTSTGRSRFVTLGTDYHLNHSPLLFTLMASYYIQGPLNFKDAWIGTGAVAWLF